MKIYSIIITLVAVLALGVAGYFYWQYAGLAGQIDVCQKDKALAESRLSWANQQLDKISDTVAVLNSVVDSFMIPGDLKALTVGSKEAAAVSRGIQEIADNQDRMMVEKNWNDFKSSLRLNALMALYRDLADNLERTLAQDINGQPSN